MIIQQGQPESMALGQYVQVGKTEWSVDATTPTLEATPNSYMFAMTNGRFLSLLLAQGKFDIHIHDSNNTSSGSRFVKSLAGMQGLHATLCDSPALPTGSPTEEAEALREILVECTLYEQAGGMTKQHTEELIQQVAHDVETDPEIPLATSQQQQPGAAPTAASRILSGAS